MYLRHTTLRKNGKTHTYWRLVRSVRRGRKVVQETVAQLGELDAHGRARAGALALRITGREEQYELFEAPPGRSEPVAVRLERVRLERAAVSAMSGWGGGCGAPLHWIVSVRTAWSRAASGRRGRRWRRSW